MASHATVTDKVTNRVQQIHTCPQVTGTTSKMTKAKVTRAKKGGGSSGTEGGDSQTTDGLQEMIQQAKPGSKKIKEGVFKGGRGG
jgi:hypothetical protein